MNAEQKSAAFFCENHSLIVACPGAGKTRTLIAKAQHLLEQHSAEEIVLITFTRKAGEQLKEKIGRDDVRVGTFHSLAFKLMREYAYNRYANTVHLMLKEEIDDFFKKKFGHKKKKNTPVIELIAYREFKHKYNRIDFDDILLDFVGFLRHSDSLPEREKLKHLLVDEYQDINQVQDNILKSWIQNGAILTAVGDEGQSIYGFRGSQIKYILEFDYPNYKKFILFKNYRNPPSIVKIAKAILPTPKIMEAQRKKGKVFIKQFTSILEQADAIALSIKENPSSVAILVRYHRQTPLLEISLRKFGIDYRIYKSSSIFDSPILKCFLSMSRVLIDKNSTPDWYVVFSFLPNVGPRTAQIWQECNFTSGKKRKKKQDQSCYNIYLWITSLPIDNIRMSISMIFQKLYSILDKKKFLTKSEKVREDLNKQVLKLQIFQKAIHLKNKEDLVDFLAQGALDNQLVRAQVEILTIHQSKGLEWDNVYLPNLTLDEFPNNRIADLSEERRLFYVAVTRTIKELHMSYVNERSIFITECLNKLKKQLK